jgi:hypothetical protein
LESGVGVGSGRRFRRAKKIRIWIRILNTASMLKLDKIQMEIEGYREKKSFYFKQTI